MIQEGLPLHFLRSMYYRDENHIYKEVHINDKLYQTEGV